MILIVMGVSGSGKTTIGAQLAARLRCGFSDADEFHSEANNAKMARGVPLDEDDRRPWLASLRAAIDEKKSQQRDWVFACSALKRAYRGVLGGDDAALRWVFLDGSEEVLARRLAGRGGHFFDPRLLHSQLQTLEKPLESEALLVSIEAPPERIVADILQRLNRHPQRDDQVS